MKMKTVSSRIALSFLSLVTLASFTACGKDPDLLYYRNPPPREEAFQEAQVRELVNGGKVDILFVIDNSGSMGPHQTALSQATGDFIGEFVKRGTGFDWQIGIISSDISQQPFLGFSPGSKCDKNTPFPESVFKSAVARVGTMGDSTERFFQPMIQHLSRGTFLRKGAYFAVFFMTDVYEQSSATPQQYYNQLTSLVGDAARTLVYGAYASSDNPNCSPETTWYWNGTSSYERRWKDFFSLSKGATRYDLCTRNLGTQMADFAKDLIVKVDSPKILLKDRPVPYTIRLEYQGQVLEGGRDTGVWFYDYQLNAIVFRTLDVFPIDTAKVQITYQVDDGRPETD
ncbi:MAG: hypothetical protein JNL01_14550 [Bdellovibrionales bacterium]|nr:hypothetical protein [Bdellovibrionales bacterium]